MNLSTELTQQVTAHLDEVRKYLGTLPADERQEILQSIESHIYDALETRSNGEPTSALLDAVIAEMDPPESYGELPVVSQKMKPRRKLIIALCGLALVALAVAGIKSRTNRPPNVIGIKKESMQHSPSLEQKRGPDRSKDSVGITRITPNINKDIISGETVIFEVEVEYNLVTSDTASITLVIQRSESGHRPLANETDVIKKGKGKITISTKVEIPDTKAIQIFTPLSVPGSMQTTVVDSRVYNVKTTPQIEQTPEPKPVTFEQGLNTLKDGDAIILNEVLASSPHFAKGDTVAVKGRYTLSSQSEAALLLTTTATEGSGRSSTTEKQNITATQGSKLFELTFIIPHQGCSRLAFYDKGTGQSLGGLYFGTKKQVEGIERPYGKESLLTTTKPSEAETSIAGSWNPTGKIIEGVGISDYRIGASKEQLIVALGVPDEGSTETWLQWKNLCTHSRINEYRGAQELRFDVGFLGKTAKGIKLGSSEEDALTAYGNPEHIVKNDWAKKLEWSSQGILVWFTPDNEVRQIVIFEPY